MNNNKISLNEELKRREKVQKEKNIAEAKKAGHTALDDTQRVKVLSPSKLVAKRFFRNKLAMLGLGILVFMFLFSFLAPLFYGYTQTQIFYKYDTLNIDYASAAVRTENTAYELEDASDVSSSAKNSINSYAAKMEESGEKTTVITDSDGAQYILEKLGEKVYTLSADDLDEVLSYSPSAVVANFKRLGGTLSWKVEPYSEEGLAAATAAAVAAENNEFTFEGEEYSLKMLSKNEYSLTRLSPHAEWKDEANLGDQFIKTAIESKGMASFEFEGKSYRTVENGDATITVSLVGEKSVKMVASTLAFNSAEIGEQFSDEFKANALMSLHSTKSFKADGESFKVTEEEDGFNIKNSKGELVCVLSDIILRRYSGQDTIPLGFKQEAQSLIKGMEETGDLTASFVYGLPEIDQNGEYVKDESGNLKNIDTEITITRKNTQYILNCNQITYLIDIFGAPSKEHVLGTDGDGMDILARMMYGGRISLMVGFVVVFIEIFIGLILGSIAGFFGKWVDMLIMRIVDIFYCIPSMPILIIMGTLFDALKVSPYKRLAMLMAVLGFLGWASVARLVRGQILSLREQEFMVAQEATGIKAVRRIFRHLIPNVMPQVIVTATMSLGAVIILESTLSFLGLGVKHPMATWGTMINSVTKSTENMIRYTHIWIPVGLLICLTVVAFNFVGDGLRDAFDPKMKQ